MTAAFPLVIVVHADAAVRVRRLVEQRGLRAPPLRHGSPRRPPTNSATPQPTCGWTTAAAVTTPSLRSTVVDQRLVPFEDNLPSSPPGTEDCDPVVAPDHSWPQQAQRVRTRVGAVAGVRACASTTSAQRRSLGWTRRTWWTCTWSSPTSRWRSVSGKPQRGRAGQTRPVVGGTTPGTAPPGQGVRDATPTRLGPSTVTSGLRIPRPGGKPCYCGTGCGPILKMSRSTPSSSTSWRRSNGTLSMPTPRRRPLHRRRAGSSAAVGDANRLAGGVNPPPTQCRSNAGSVPAQCRSTSVDTPTVVSQRSNQ